MCSLHSANLSMASRSRFLLPVAAVASVIAFLFTILCLCAGEQEISGLPLFTINLSHVGEFLKEELDQKIRSIHLKRSAPGIAAGATPTPLQRFDVPHAVTTALSPGRSKLVSVESNARSHAISILHAGGEQLVEAVNDAYEEVLADLHLGGKHEYYANEFGVIQVFYIFSVVFVAFAIGSCVAMLRLEARIERYGIESKVCVCVWWVRRVLEACAPFMLLLSSAFATAATLGVRSMTDMFGKVTDIECELGGGFLALTWLAFCLQASSTYLVFKRGGRGEQEKQAEPKYG